MQRENSMLIEKMTKIVQRSDPINIPKTVSREIMATSRMRNNRAAAL